MNSLLAFLLTIQTEKFQFGDLEKSLLAQLQLGPDLQSVQEKLDAILTANPELEPTYKHFKTQLEQEPNLLALLPNVKVSKLPLTRSAEPGKPEQETNEIPNAAVKIGISVLKNDKHSADNKKLLRQLADKLTLRNKPNRF